MATNRVHADARQLNLAPTDPTSGGLSGDPCVVGQIPGVMLIDEASAKSTVDFGGSYNLSVKGVDGGGNSAVAVGDILYYVSGDTPKISKKNSGVRYGYALGTVGSGSTGTIEVKLGY